MALAIAYATRMMARGADTSTTHGATVRTSVPFLFILCATVYVRLLVGVAWPPFGTLHPSPSVRRVSLYNIFNISL